MNRFLVWMGWLIGFWGYDFGLLQHRLQTRESLGGSRTCCIQFSYVVGWYLARRGKWVAKFKPYIVWFDMQRSRKRHPLAVLRLELGLTQKEMAAFARTAMITIQSIEAGKRPLKEKLAKHIAMISGVQLYWLLGGDPNAPMITESGEPYTRGLFEQNRKLLFEHKHSQERKDAEREFIPEILAMALLKSYSILREGHTRNRLAWAAYKLQMALQGVEDELGADEVVDAKVEELLKDHPTKGKFDAAVHLVKRMHVEPGN